jgi:hypothetical protein
MDRLLDSIAGFHDSMTKEIHMVNRGYVTPDHTMMMGLKFDAQVLIQSQWDPFGLEMVFVGVKDIHLTGPGEYWGATGSVELKLAPVKEKRIKMRFDSSFTVVSEGLFYRVRSEWLGKKSFLKSEVPSDMALPAQIIRDKWRQCSSCHDAWEEELGEVFSFCPSCGELTEVQ